jgi:tRNA pseudouridine38-40 synthase
VPTFRLVVSYDGTEFHGWQVQPGQRTVQGVLEEAMMGVLGVDGIRIHGAGRTDAGVHARGQVASFSADTRIPAIGLRHSLNRMLPDDVRVTAADEAPVAFHARHSARARRYAYRLLAADDVLLRRIAWRPPRSFDAQALAAAVAPLEGEHDFVSFRATGGTESRTVCVLSRARWTAWEGGVRFDVVADHFLYHMVRNLVGTALAAASASDPAAAMRAVMAARDRRRAGITAPPQGLCLEQVDYAEDES